MEKNSRSQASLLWVLAIIITLSSVYYQRQTGPTYPVKGTVEIAGEQISYYFPRSQNTGENALISLEYADTSLHAALRWKRFKSNDQWRLTPFILENGKFIAQLPPQPPAGKIIYSVYLTGKGESAFQLRDEATIIRYKGAVPLAVLLPHILFMFTAMLLATRSGMAAWVESPATLRYVTTTGILLFMGGLILGPLVQKFAFDAYWTGWPWGHDLTDNKTAVAFIAWILAIWKIRKQGSAKGWVIAAAVITLLVYLIPHSALGSELDYTQLEQ